MTLGVTLKNDVCPRLAIRERAPQEQQKEAAWWQKQESSCWKNGPGNLKLRGAFFEQLDWGEEGNTFRAISQASLEYGLQWRCYTTDIWQPFHCSSTSSSRKWRGGWSPRRRQRRASASAVGRGGGGGGRGAALRAKTATPSRDSIGMGCSIINFSIPILVIETVKQRFVWHS